jgi:hypothetical protein
MITKRCHQWRNILIWYAVVKGKVSIEQARTLNHQRYVLSVEEAYAAKADLEAYHGENQ